MTKHDPGDVYWNRYRERSLAEVAHHMRLRKLLDTGNGADNAEVDSSKPPANEAE